MSAPNADTVYSYSLIRKNFLLEGKVTYEFNQLFIAESFQAMYLDSRGRSTLSREDLHARQEVCEELAQSLAEHCLGLRFRDDAFSAEVLTQLHVGLLNSPSSLPACEARWVTIRTAELLQWDVPDHLSQRSSLEVHG
jgi:hypothetical protein